MLQHLEDARLRAVGVRLFLWRLDQYPGAVSGNKIFKLIQNMDRALAKGYSRVASFGGAWSNHLHALAAGARERGLKSLGFVRGEEHQPRSAMLCDAEEDGMQLHFLSRSDYRLRNDPAFLKELQHRHPDCYWLPEGGSNREGVRGCVDLGLQIADSLEGAFTLALACGTGGTLAGAAAGLAQHARQASVRGYAVLKGAEFLHDEIRHHLLAAGMAADNWMLETGFHGGGYAKCDEDLHRFIVDFYSRHGVALEPVYTGKLLQAIYAQARAGELQGVVVALHSGGLQGLRGFPNLLADLAEMGFEGL